MPLKKLWQRSIFTRAGLEKLHGRRQQTNPTEGNRSTPTLTMVVAITMLLMMAIFQLMWVQKDAGAFLASLNGVDRIPTRGSGALQWAISASNPTFCEVDALTACAQSQTFKAVYSGDNPYDLALDKLVDRKTEKSVTLFKFNTTVPAARWQQAAENHMVAFQLHPFVFDRAVAFVNGVEVGQFFDGQMLAPYWMHDKGPATDLTIEVLASVSGQQRVLLADTSESAIVFAASAERHRKFVDMTAVRRTGHGKQLADIARVVLAVFSLLLFVFVDSSPESLGLALFMGIKAIAVVFAQNWLPETWLGTDGVVWARHALLCFGDIMQLYFFTQLARIVKPRLKPWFLIGGAVACVYATVSVAQISYLGINWTTELWRFRNVSVGLSCMLVASTSAVYLIRQGLYYRGVALLVAFSGTIVQVIYPIMGYWPEIFQSAGFRTFYHIMETHTPYVFALSTFINISTLENRVKNLSKELVAAKEIEREMELGETVQRSFLRLPTLPKGLRLDHAHEAALYVSGDLYYANWDESQEMLTMLITDVTGHGVQAALKASICTTIADSIWAEGQVRASDQPGYRLKTYDMRLHSFLTKVSGAPEIVSLVGAEFDAKSGVTRLYRVNGVFPVLLEPTASGWDVRALPAVHREIMTVNLAVGGALILVSDGFIDSSRGMNDFKRHLVEQLPKPSAIKDSVPLSAIRETIFNFTGFAATNDDRTMLIFQRGPYESSGTASVLDGDGQQRRVA